MPVTPRHAKQNKMDSEYTWDKKDTITLIKLYKDYPLLWHPQHSDYKNRAARQTAIRKVSEQMGIERPEIERKYKNLLSHYLRELKREAEKKGYVSKWFAYNALSYLKDRPFDPAKLKRVKRIKEDENSDAEIEDEIIYETQDSEPEGSFSSATFSTNLAQTIKKSNSTDDPLNETAVLRPVDLGSTSLMVKDDATIFGEHIANKIRNMDQRTRAIVEYEINSTVFRAEMGYFSDKQFDFNKDLGLRPT